MQVRALWRLAAIGSVAALAVTGCSESAGSGSGGETAGSIKVVMAQYSDATTPFWTGVVRDFEKANPDVDVQLQVVDWNTLLQQVPTWTQTNTLPDVLNFNAFSTFADEDLLHPMSDIVDADLQQDFIPNLAANGELDGTEYGIPFIASVRTLGYNQEILNEIGAEPPTTWDELVDVAEKAEKAGHTGYCLPLGSEESQGEWSLWSWANGGDWKAGDDWAIDSAENVETLEFLRDLSNTRQVTQPNPGKTNRTDGCWESFAQGDVAMTAVMPLGTFQTTFMADSGVKWESVPFPRASADMPPFTLGVTDFLMGFKQPGNTEPVSKFMSFVFEQERYVEFIKSEGFLPTTQSASEQMADDPIAGPGIELLPKARFYPTTDPAWNQVQTGVQSQLGTAMEPDADPAEVLAQLQQEAMSGN
ncbi:MAG TPA: extracellular solute-binding protein [Nocardioidaceae bacterium]|nr:extracellular solute-binding protein [Nocardioidaceae bacterium]